MADFEKVKKALDAYNKSKSDLEENAMAYLKVFVKEHGGEYEFGDDDPENYYYDAPECLWYNEEEGEYCNIKMKKLYLDKDGDVCFNFYKCNRDGDIYDELEEDGYFGDFDFKQLMGYSWDELE